MSPLIKSQLKRFKKNKLGMSCLLIFGFIFLISLCSEWIANDKPLLIYYKQSIYIPIVHDYPETIFGGEFETTADYQDPVVQKLIQQYGWMIFAPIRFSAQTPNLSLDVPVPSPPSRQNWLGTDDQGRDVLAQILYGLRVSLLFSFTLTLFAVVLGTIIGAIQGYYGGWIDLIGQRLLEVWNGLPMLFIVMILVSMLSPNVYWLFFIMLLFGWTELVGLVRAEFLRARQLDYVRAAKALGMTDYHIIFRHILPNAMSSSLSQIPFILTANIIALTALDFLGYGLASDSASLGELLLQGKNNLDAPWLVLSGFFSLALVLSLLIYIGEAARDAFDPR